MLYADLHDATLARKLAALTAVPGYRICVDILDSVALKDRSLEPWVCATLETFACVQTAVPALKYGPTVDEPPLSSLTGLDRRTAAPRFRRGGAIQPLEGFPERRPQTSKLAQPFLDLTKPLHDGGAHVLARWLAA